MKILKTLRLFGEDWKVIAKRDGKNKFSYDKKTMWLDTDHLEECFFHELLELLMMDNYNRFYGQEGSMEYMFIMSHTDFSIVAEKLARVLRDNKLLK